MNIEQNLADSFRTIQTSEFRAKLAAIKKKLGKSDFAKIQAGAMSRRANAAKAHEARIKKIKTHHRARNKAGESRKTDR